MPKGNVVAESGPESWPPNPGVSRDMVNGLKVVVDEVLPSGLSKPGKLVPIKGIRRLTLEDDSVVLGCADCLFVAVEDTQTFTKLGQVRQHRAIKHGTSLGGVQKKTRADVEEVTVSQARLPENVRAMTIGEAVDLAVHADEWEQVFSTQQEKIEALVAERDGLRIELRAKEREFTGLQKRMARAMGLKIVETEEK